MHNSGYKDYSAADGQQDKEMTVSADEFLRRLLLHSLPPGFQRIRHYGLLASRSKRENLALCRQLLQAPPEPDKAAVKERLLAPLLRCPKCHTGVMVRILFLPASTGRPQLVDTS